MRLSKFRTQRRFWHHAESVEVPEGSGGVNQWILSRALCRYTSVPLPMSLPQGRREAAVRLQILSWSPFAETGMHHDWSGTRVGAWVWDQSKVEEAARANGVSLRRSQVLPETTVAEPMTDGVRLVECLDGCEGQVWRAGQLAASRWWPREPTPNEWLTFMRAASVPAEADLQSVPVAVPPKWLQSPWTHEPSVSFALLQRVNLPRAAAAAAIVMCLPLVYEMSALTRLVLEKNRIETRLAQVMRGAEPIALARAAALDAAECVRGLLSLDPYPSQLSIMSKIAPLIPVNGAHLTDWVFQGGELRFTVANSPTPLDVAVLIRAFEGTGLFEKVGAESQGDGRSLAVIGKVRAS